MPATATALPCCLTCGSSGLRKLVGQRHTCTNCGGEYIVNRAGRVREATRKRESPPPPKPQKALVRWLLSKDNACRIDGEPGADTTGLACYLGFCIATGRRVFDQLETTQCPVTMIGTGTDPGGLQGTLFWLCKAARIDMADLSDRLRVFDLAKDDYTKGFSHLLSRDCGLLIVDTPSQASMNAFTTPSVMIRGIGPEPRDVNRFEMLCGADCLRATFRAKPFCRPGGGSVRLVQKSPHVWSVAEDDRR